MERHEPNVAAGEYVVPRCSLVRYSWASSMKRPRIGPSRQGQGRYGPFPEQSARGFLCDWKNSRLFALQQARLNEFEPRHLLEAFGDISGFFSCCPVQPATSHSAYASPNHRFPTVLEVNGVSGHRSNPQDSSNNKSLHAKLQTLQCDHQTPACLDSRMMCHADVLRMFVHGIHGLNCFSCFHVLIETWWRSPTSGSAGLATVSWLWSWLTRHLRHPTHHTDRHIYLEHKSRARVNSRGTCGCATCC